MPANTHARYYQWFMTEDHSAREGGHVEVQSAVEDATGRDPRD